MLRHRDIQRTPIWKETAPSKAPEAENQPTPYMDTSYALAILKECSESTIDKSQPTPARVKVISRGIRCPVTVWHQISWQAIYITLRVLESDAMTGHGIASPVSEFKKRQF